MTSNNDDDIRRLLSPAPDVAPDRRGVARAVKRARATVAQRDTLGFAIVRIWTTLGTLLAPFFATLATQQARTKLQRGAPPDPSEKLK